MSVASPAVMEAGAAFGEGVGSAVFTGVTSVDQASFSRLTGPDGIAVLKADLFYKLTEGMFYGDH